VLLGALLIGSKTELGEPPGDVLDLDGVKSVRNTGFPLRVPDALKGNRPRPQLLVVSRFTAQFFLADVPDGFVGQTTDKDVYGLW
jgi:hypothetical protein